MLLMSHFDKTVINIGAKSPPTDTWINNLNIVGIKDNKMSCDVIEADFCYLPPSQLKILNSEACG